MNKFSKYFLSGVFLLVMLLSMWFVFADSYDVAPSTAEAEDTITMLIFNVTNNGTGGNTFNTITINNEGDASAGNFTNITVSNETWVKSNSSFSAFPIMVTISETVAADQNYTVNVTLDSSATYGVTIQINVTAISTEANVTHSAVPFNSTTTTITETTDPTATAICDPDVLYAGTSFPCSCSGTDDGATASGVNTETGSSTSPDGTSTPTSTGTFTYTCTVTDIAGNSASATATYTVSSSGGAGPSISQPPRKIHSWTKITPGVAAIMRDFDSEIGVKQIRVRVRNEVQNVKITVTKYSAKPAEVSVAKTGKTYQYLHINAENFGEDIEQATVEFRAERSWAAGVELGKNDIAVFRYNETASRWDELTTTSTGEDATYYYYEVELDEFSYFAIGEKSVVGEEEEEEEGGISVWVWILVAAVIIAIVVWQMKTKKK